MEFDFLSPLDDEILEFINGLSSQNLGSKVVLHTSKDFPDLNKIKLAIIGVKENRGAHIEVENTKLSHIRKELYGLFPGNWEASIADLGNILAGEIFAKAEELNLMKVVARMAADQKGAIQVFERLGFTAEALLADYVIDRKNRTHDLIAMSYDITGFTEE